MFHKAFLPSEVDHDMPVTVTFFDFRHMKIFLPIQGTIEVLFEFAFQHVLHPARVLSVSSEAGDPACQLAT